MEIINDTENIPNMNNKHNRKKYDFDGVKQIIESRGYTLTSTQYNRAKDKLNVICPNGHSTTIIFKNFKNRNSGCSTCARSIPRKKYEKKNNNKREKYTIEFVKKIFENEGYVVHTTELPTIKTKIEFTCPNNHNGSMLFYGFYINGSRCNQCKYLKMADQFKYDINEIKKEFNELNYKLLSTTYISGTPVKFICSNNHETEMLYRSWKNSEHKCYPCYLKKLQKSKAFTYEQVKEIFENKNCILLTNNYINAKQSLEYICPNNHQTSTTLDNFNRSNNVVCGYCSQIYKKTIEEIKIEFENVGYTLLSKEYIGAKSPLKFICNIGHRHQISWTHFDSGQRCAQCTSNRGIDECVIYLKKHNIPYKLEYKFPDCKNIRPLPFDIYVNNTFIIERDGQQHFEAIDRFGGINTYISQIDRDRIKTMYCINKNIPLLRISYKELKQTSTIIENFINQLKTHDKTIPLVCFSNPILYKHQMNLYDKQIKMIKDVKDTKNVKNVKTVKNVQIVA